MKDKLQKLIIKLFYFLSIVATSFAVISYLNSETLLQFTRLLLRAMLNIQIKEDVVLIGKDLADLSVSNLDNKVSLLILSFVIAVVLFVIYENIKNVIAEAIFYFGSILFTFSLTIVLLFNSRLWPLGQTLILLTITFGITLIYRYLEKIIQIYYLKNVFGMYVNQEIIDEYINHPERLRISGKVKNVTVMFTDVRDFTTLTEEMEPNTLLSFLHQYLTLQSEVIINKHGFIDKYIGDSIMAVWNAVTEDHNHGSKAVQAALDIYERLSKFNHKKFNLPQIDIGIGISTGDTIVGNIGSAKKINYTVIGDNVNTSSRLESLTKKYGVPILVTDRTVGECTNLKNVIFRELDKVVVKGKTLPISIFQPLNSTEENVELKGVYESALRKYYKGDFESALIQLEKIEIDDTPTKLLIKRCNDLRKSPKDNWNGVWEWKDK